MGKLGKIMDTAFRGIRKFSALKNDFIRQSALDNGVTLTTQRRYLNSTLSFQLMVNAGSQEDPGDKEGVGHFLEHLLIGKETNKEFIKRSGHVGLWTSAYHIAMTGELPYSKENADFLLRSMTEFMRGSALSETEFNKEKRRILNEIGLKGDEAEFRLAQLMAPSFDTGRGNSNILGTKEGIKNTTLEDLKNYRETWFTGRNTFIGMTGPFEHGDMLRRVKENLSGVPDHALPRRNKPVLVAGDYRNKEDFFEQAYFSICFPLPEMTPNKLIVHNLAQNYLSYRVRNEIIFGSGIVYDASVQFQVSSSRPGTMGICGNIMKEEAGEAFPEISNLIVTTIEGMDNDIFGLVKKNMLHGFQKKVLHYPLYSSGDLAIMPLMEGRPTPAYIREKYLESLTPEDVHRYLVDEVFSHDPVIVTLGDDSHLGRYEDFVAPIRQTLAKMNLPCPK